MNPYETGRAIFDYGVKGGLIAAGAALGFFSLASTFGWLPQPPSERLLAVLLNYFLVGGLAGALVGTAVLWLRRRK